MEICFDGIGQVAATFAVSGQTEPGTAVTLTGSGIVAQGGDGDQLCGVMLGKVRDGVAAVQIGGTAEVSWSGAAPKAGWQGLACDGEGGVKAAADGASFLVLAVDESKGTAVIRL